MLREETKEAKRKSKKKKEDIMKNQKMKKSFKIKESFKKWGIVSNVLRKNF